MKKQTFARGTDLIDSFLKKLSQDDSCFLVNLKENWTDTVGEQVARNTSPKSYSNGILNVAVTSGVWKSELKKTPGRVLAGHIREKYPRIKKVVFI